MDKKPNYGPQHLYISIKIMLMSISIAYTAHKRSKADISSQEAIYKIARCGTYLFTKFINTYYSLYKYMKKSFIFKFKASTSSRIFYNKGYLSYNKLITVYKLYSSALVLYKYGFKLYSNPCMQERCA